MSIATRTRKIAVIAAVAGLCALTTGCVSDMGAPTASQPTGGELRYFGGPKYPMWSSGQGQNE
jgi:hypothetical protein